VNNLVDMLKAQSEAIQRAWAAGHKEGYRAGFNEGIAEAQKIINKVFPRDSEAKEESRS
jgi:flagellar biosynthesis/type III secretory pathway protein FliH